jgi:formiminotetrahydrofolate cyclodeaminase/quercetin dioxygenase-like cupin family protein
VSDARPPASLAGHTVDSLLDAFATAQPTPGGGSAAALAAAGAAALVERCATASPKPEFARARARAAELRRDLVALADQDATALDALVAATRSSGNDLAVALAAASGPPALLHAAATEVAEMASVLARDGARSSRGEAHCARLLASAAAAMAEAIVALNGEPAGAADDVDAEGPVVDLARPVRGRGPQWGMQSPELNATLLGWPAGAGVPEHRNTERDVLLVVLDGSAELVLDGIEHRLRAHQLVLLPRGSSRALTAGPLGVRYLSIHLRREPMLPRAHANAGA